MVYRGMLWERQRDRILFQRPWLLVRTGPLLTLRLTHLTQSHLAALANIVRSHTVRSYSLACQWFQLGRGLLLTTRTVGWLMK